MSRTKIAINGLGRIGRCVMRAIIEQGYESDFEIVAVNGPAPTPTHVHLLKYDSVHGRFNGELSANGDEMTFGSYTFPVYHERNPENLPWGELDVDVVLECTGIFLTQESAGAHLKAGAKKVLLSAPAKDNSKTIVFGVNNQDYNSDVDILSVGSCTTNCLAPVAKILNDNFGIESGFMTTIHAYTGDQNLVDSSHKDMRRARAAGLSMVPTGTGAAKALGLVLPELQGKLDGTAIRVPTPNVSLVDLTFTSTKPMTAEAINDAMISASQGAMKGVIATSNEPLVSIDYTHNPASSVFDITATKVMGSHFARIASWYDNEWGFSCRMLDIAKMV